MIDKISTSLFLCTGFYTSQEIHSLSTFLFLYSVTNRVHLWTNEKAGFRTSRSFKLDKLTLRMSKLKNRSSLTMVPRCLYYHCKEDTLFYRNLHTITGLNKKISSKMYFFYRYYYIKTLVVTSLVDIPHKKFFMVAFLKNKMAPTDRDYSPFYN